MLIGRNIRRKIGFKVKVLGIGGRLATQNGGQILFQMENRIMWVRNQVQLRKYLQFSQYRRFYSTTNQGKSEENNSEPIIEEKKYTQNHEYKRSVYENTKLSIKTKGRKTIARFNEQILSITNGKINITAIGYKIKIRINQFCDFLHTYAIIPFKQTKFYIIIHKQKCHYMEKLQKSTGFLKPKETKPGDLVDQNSYTRTQKTLNELYSQFIFLNQVKDLQSDSIQNLVEKQKDNKIHSDIFSKFIKVFGWYFELIYKLSGYFVQNIFKFIDNRRMKNKYVNLNKTEHEDAKINIKPKFYEKWKNKFGDNILRLVLIYFIQIFLVYQSGKFIPKFIQYLSLIRLKNRAKSNK